MKLSQTQFVQRSAAKLASSLAKDPELRAQMGGEKLDEGSRRRVLHRKAAATYVGLFLAVLGFVGGFVSLGVIFWLLKIKVIEGTPMFLAALVVPGALFLLGIAGAVNISKELKDSLGWVALFLRSIVAIFRKLPNEPPPPPAV